jgi:hypothetical protein
MRDQAHAFQLFPFEQVDDIGDVGVEHDVLAEQVRAVGEPGQRWCEYLVTLGFEQIRDAPPAPECLAAARLCHRFSSAQCCRARADRRPRERGTACHAVDAGHPILPEPARLYLGARVRVAVRASL